MGTLAFITSLRASVCGGSVGKLRTYLVPLGMLPNHLLTSGTAVAALGNRFVDMCTPYSTYVNDIILAQASTLNMVMHQGTYVAVQGPNLETKAEYRYLKAAGADMVGMSTVPEVIVANHIGLPCAAISVITDECNPNNLQPVVIAEIIATAHAADKQLAPLLSKVIYTLGTVN